MGIGQTPPNVHRTTVHVDHVDGDTVVCTPGGVDLPVSSGRVPLAAFPLTLRNTIEPGKVFFACVNLLAKSSDELMISQIENKWGDTGPLHFG